MILSNVFLFTKIYRCIQTLFLHRVYVVPSPYWDVSWSTKTHHDRKDVVKEHFSGCTNHLRLGVQSLAYSTNPLS